MTLTGNQKHVGALEQPGLVTAERVGEELKPKERTDGRK